MNPTHLKHDNCIDDMYEEEEKEVNVEMTGELPLDINKILSNSRKCLVLTRVNTIVIFIILIILALN